MLAFRIAPALVLAAMAALAASPAPNTLSAQEKAAGWILLFDGKTLDQWRDPRNLNPPGDAWAVEDGCIKANAKTSITEDLFSRDTYRNFEFEWDWKIALGGNSGVKYRIQRTVWLTAGHPKLPRFEDIVQWFIDHPVTGRPAKGQDYVIGLEYQMIDDERHPDARAGKTHVTGALYDMVAPSADRPLKPAGEWNHSLLKVQGDHAEHWLNGVKVVDTGIAPADLKPKMERRWGKTPGVFFALGDQARHDCPISLQNHDSDTWFRNLKIRPLNNVRGSAN